jgi:hypothetical protein
MHGETKTMSEQFTDSITPRFPNISEDDKDELWRERGRLIQALGVVEEILNEKHGMHLATV